MGENSLCRTGIVFSTLLDHRSSYFEKRIECIQIESVYVMAPSSNIFLYLIDMMWIAINLDRFSHFNFSIRNLR